MHFVFVSVTDWQWKVVAERLGLRAKEIAFLDMRYLNPSEAALTFVAQYRGMNVDCMWICRKDHIHKDDKKCMQNLEHSS